MNIGIYRWKDDHYKITDPLLKIELVMFGTSFDLSMSVPSERNAIRE